MEFRGCDLSAGAARIKIIKGIILFIQISLHKDIKLLFKGIAVGRYNGTMVQWYDGTTVRWYDGMMVRWYGGTTVRWSGGTIAREHYYSADRALISLVNIIEIWIQSSSNNLRVGSSM